VARGGKREGAGRKKGALTERTRKIAENATASGESPLEYMLRVMRDPAADESMRADMAKSAAPYVHPRLASTQLTGGDGGPLTVEIVKLADASHSTS
jgi:hypothetical protein